MDNRKTHIFDGTMVKIMACADCNTKCEHCYISYKGNIDKKTLEEIIKNLKGRYQIKINGTEPLLHHEYLPSLKRLNQRTVMTNGLVFKNNYEYLDILKDMGIKNIAVSYHFELHNIISKVDKTYLESLFKEINKRGLTVTVMTTLSTTNYKNIEKYCEFCYKNNIRGIRFTNYLKQGNATNLDDNLVLSNHQIRYIFNKIKEIRNKYDVNDLRILRCGSFGNDNYKESNFKCPAGIESVILTPNLKIYACLFLAEIGREIGYYKDGNIYIYDDFEPHAKYCSAKRILNNVK